MFKRLAFYSLSHLLEARSPMNPIVALEFNVSEWICNEHLTVVSPEILKSMHGPTLECLINVPVRVFISRKMPPYTGLIWHYTFIKKKKKIFFFFFFYI